MYNVLQCQARAQHGTFTPMRKLRSHLFTLGVLDPHSALENAVFARQSLHLLLVQPHAVLEPRVLLACEFEAAVLFRGERMQGSDLMGEATQGHKKNRVKTSSSAYGRNGPTDSSSIHVLQ